MIDIILASHGGLASGFLQASEMILGQQKNTKVLELFPGESLEDYTIRFREAIDKSENPEDVLVLTDLPGGTPSNTGALLSLQKGVTCITGSNLPMVLEAFAGRSGMDMGKLCQAVMETGVSTVKNLTEELSKNL